MPYPESCPECGSQFRNSGTHFTARRNEVGRHVLLELGCQNTSRRFWWDFTAGQLTDEGQRMPAPREALVMAVAASNGAAEHTSNGNGHVALAALDLPSAEEPDEEEEEIELDTLTAPVMPSAPPADTIPAASIVETPPTLGVAPSPDALKDAFVRQLQLDRLTLRQMRALLMSEEARRAIEVAVGATEATYERLALILFGADLPQLMGKPPAAAAPPQISAEERLELQREKARIRARLRRAAIKAARLSE